jgi:hypothetical protein
MRGAVIGGAIMNTHAFELSTNAGGAAADLENLGETVIKVYETSVDVGEGNYEGSGQPNPKGEPLTNV